MNVLVARESVPHERRVAVVPELVGRLTDAGLEVLVEAGAGVGALHGDDDYRSAGASVVSDGDGPLSGADVVVSVQPLAAGRARHLRRGAVTISFLSTTQELSLVRTYRDVKVTAFSLELVPRISRAQSMDALSSQALVAGYRAALVA
ncbi:MAG TPA: NAD(P)(+) transhydrogenase (Re/Si-specific) subunit alpha, partial [Jiangellaceae bacterium]